MWYVYTWWFYQTISLTCVIESKQNCKCTLLMSYQWGMIWIYFKSNENYVLGIGKHGNSRLGGWNWLQAIATTKKGIETCNNMSVKHFRSRAIVGHLYPIVSIGFHEHAMTDMMVLN